MVAPAAVESTARLAPSCASLGFTSSMVVSGFCEYTLRATTQT